MKIIEFYTSKNKEHWLSEIQKCKWEAGQYLHHLLKERKLKELVGTNTKVLMLINGTELISFCTFADKDDIQPTDLTPWIGWLYTFPQHRGNHYAGKLFEYAEASAKKEGIENIYLSTNHVGLYEKYGYKFLQIMKDIDGEDSRVYVKKL